jgi:hypothetical protein
MRRARAIVALALGSTALAGCSGVDATIGPGEPLRVTQGSFQRGELPGEPPPAADAPPDAPKKDPHVTLIESVNNVIAPGQGEKSLSGRATEGAVAIGLRFGDIGSGYWVVPAGSLDPQAPGERDWKLGFEIARDAPPGLHTLRIAAIDDAGRAGTQAELPVCITSPVPDNLNACDPTIAPPVTVVSLSWDGAADLDLGVVTPSGKVVSAKHPSTATGAPPKPDPNEDGVIDHDANAGCGDRTGRESLVWQSKPAAGTYLVYADLFSACGDASATFVVTVYVAESRGDGTSSLVPKLRVPGELLAAQADGGGSKGLYVTAFSIQ